VTRIFFSAGETSGDMHGAELVRVVRTLDPSVACEGIGGPLMQQAGMTLRYNLAERGIMGFTEVVRSFGFIRRLFLDTVDEFRRDPPDALVLIDYPGFNIRLAQKAKALGIKVYYYISPQVWAWKKKRIHTLARVVDKMIVILPFERALYEEVGVDCVYVGHPLLDYAAAHEASQPIAGDPVIGLLPGSREQEIARLLPTMLGVAAGIRDAYPNARFVTPCVDAARAQQVRQAAADFPLEVVVGRMYDVLGSARFCMVASGTATLETAIFGVPMVILYRISPASYWLAKRLVTIEHIGLVNIMAEQRVVPEFIQGEATPENILPVALELIGDTPGRVKMHEDLQRVRRLLGGPGASERAARAILEDLKGGCGA
jgi:lipid-A-disaccharide synthase